MNYISDQMIIHLSVCLAYQIHKNDGTQFSDIGQTRYAVYLIYERLLWHIGSIGYTPHKWFDSISDSTLRVLFTIGVMGSLLTSPAISEIMV
jgi:hypothetical protein